MCQSRQGNPSWFRNENTIPPHCVPTGTQWPLREAGHRPYYKPPFFKRLPIVVPRNGNTSPPHRNPSRLQRPSAGNGQPPRHQQPPTPQKNRTTFTQKPRKIRPHHNPIRHRPNGGTTSVSSGSSTHTRTSPVTTPSHPPILQNFNNSNAPKNRTTFPQKNRKFRSITNR